MPRLNTSKHVKARTRQLLERLLNYANYELPEGDEFYDRLTVRWKNENTTAPELVVETELKVLIELAFSQSETPRLKDQLRNDLRVLEEFLEILEDNRARTQGAKHWRFTLKLWGKSTESNLTAFESTWDERKRRRSKRRGNVIVPATAPSNGDESSDTGADDDGADDGGSAGVRRPSAPPPSSPTGDSTVSSSDAPPTSSGGGPQASCTTDPISSSERCQIRSNLLMQQGASYNDNGYLPHLIELLSFTAPTHLITIEGQGGVGKTTLALEAARLCQLASENPTQFASVPKFEAIIFTSAQAQHFNGPDLCPRLGHQRNLQDIFRTICRTLDRLSSIPPDFRDQLDYVRTCLSGQKTLLIVDNLETLEDKEYVLSFLREIPHTVKVLVTSRVRLGMGDTLSMRPLTKSGSIALIRQQATAQALSLSQRQIRKIYALTGGLPLAIVYSLGLVAAFGINPSHLQSADLSSPSSDLARHCFNVTVERLRQHPAYNLLLAFACFRRPAKLEALAHVAHASPSLRQQRQPFNELYRLSLIELHNDCYTMHSLTREYATAELKANPAFEIEARERWIDWYLEFLSVHAEENWYDWHPTSPIESEWANIREVVDWCREVNAYNDFIELWNHLKGYTQNYGYWNERREWMQWLIEESERRHDWSTMADAMYHYSHTLYFFDQTELRQEALKVAHRVWELSATDNWKFLTNVAILLASIYAAENQCDLALAWIAKGEKLLENIPLELKKYERLWVNAAYYKAEIFLKNKDYSNAKETYQIALARAETAEIQRACVYIKGALGVIAIANQQIDHARELIKDVLSQAEHHKDLRCMAISYGHLAKIERTLGNVEQSQAYASLAREYFDLLSMKEQATAMQSLAKSEEA